jgi:predicted Zn-dependent peptidase
MQDAIANYNTNFVPGNAYLVIVGDVKTNDVKKLVTKLFSSWKSISTNTYLSDLKCSTNAN